MKYKSGIQNINWVQYQFKYVDTIKIIRQVATIYIYNTIFLVWVRVAAI